jgi:hypothetical protein
MIFKCQLSFDFEVMVQRSVSIIQMIDDRRNVLTLFSRD